MVKMITVLPTAGERGGGGRGGRCGGQDWAAAEDEDEADIEFNGTARRALCALKSKLRCSHHHPLLCHIAPCGTHVPLDIKLLGLWSKFIVSANIFTRVHHLTCSLGS